MVYGNVVLGDCLDVMKLIPAGMIDAIVTDPPFAFTGGLSNGSSANISSQFFDHWWRDVCTELQRVVKPDGEGFIWCDWKTAPSIADGFKPKTQTYDSWRVAQMIYHYREMPGQGRPFRSSVDMIAYARGPKSKGNRISASTHNHISKYWYYGKHKYHPSEKDVELCEQLIKYCSDPGDTIIDPFAGSGTVAVACIRTGREYYCIEREETYINTMLDRIKSEEILDGSS